LEEKKKMVQSQGECATMIEEEITTQALEVLAEKDVQVKERGRELANKLHSLVEAVKGERTT
jgi:hypothetical protein